MTFPVGRSRRLAVLLAALLLPLGLLVSCGEDETPTAEAPSTTTTTSDAGESVDPPDAFPVTVSAANGEVTIEARPEAVLSLSPSLTEMLYAMGAGDQVAAVDQYSNHPEGTPVTDLSGFRPNLEAIVGYEPDLVVLASDRDGIVAALEATGVPTLLLPSAPSVEDALDQIGVLATATGHPEAGDELAARIRADLDDLAARADGIETVTYYYELSDSYHSATSDSFIGSLLALIGLESIADGVAPEAGAFPQLSAESILDADPDLILVAGAGSVGASPEEIAARPGWDQLTAVAEGRIVALDADVSSRWGPRIVELLAAVADAVEAAGLR
ncbi:MAG: ABC transporter substrate-binding protein [Acidimicrobiales bacterium]